MPKAAPAFLLVVCVGALLEAVGLAFADAVHNDVAYNIPAEPLGTALETYARVSGREVLYDGRLTEGLRSSPVEGAYTAETALWILLVGSGLRADAKDDGFFVISPEPTRRTTNNGLSRSAIETRYYGVLQAGLRTTLCNSHALPDSSRIAARLWLGENGAVLQAKLLESTGNNESDRRAVAALHQLQVAGPPPGFAQPVTIVILPRAPNTDDGCATPRPLPIRAAP